MTDENVYAIGNADSFGVIVTGAVWDVEYDLKQVQEEGYAKYDIPALERDGYFETDGMAIGDVISTTIAEDAVENIGTVHGFVVPDHMLGHFIETFPDKEVCRQHE